MLSRSVGGAQQAEKDDVGLDRREAYAAHAHGSLLLSGTQGGRWQRQICGDGRASCGIYKESKEEDARDMYAQQNKAVHTSDY